MSINVDQLYTKLTDLIRTNGLGLLELDGTLHDWTIRRGNIATGDLTTATARLRIYANQHATCSAIGDLAHAGFDGSGKIPVTAIGHLVVDPKWGLQLDLKRLRPHHAHTSVDLGRPAPNADLAWPATITTIGLIAPAGGDDALADVHAHLDAGIAIIEHRVAFTGPRAVINIIHALDRLALDPRPDVTLLVRGGGPTADFAPFDDPLVLTAIDRYRHPIVTGLGHATNTTAADYTVHTSCATPTAAALHLRASHNPSTTALSHQAPNGLRHGEPLPHTTRSSAADRRADLASPDRGRRATFSGGVPDRHFGDATHSWSTRPIGHEPIGGLPVRSLLRGHRPLSRVPRLSKPLGKRRQPASGLDVVLGEATVVWDACCDTRVLDRTDR